MESIETKHKFFDKTYKDAKSLLEQAMDYAIYEIKYPSEHRKNLEKLNINAEMLKITSRLMECMAWLLAQKAFQRGEITVVEASSEKYFPTDKPIFLEEVPEHVLETLPGALQHLIQESKYLYRRVRHLANIGQEQARKIH